jgi:uncharacterized protein involved in type VI secretion and phage assembly
MSPRDIANAVVAKASGLDTDFAQLPSQSIRYEAQFEETDWDFLRRLSASHGTWLCYAGGALKAIKSFSGETVRMRVGSGSGPAFEQFALEARVLSGAFAQTVFLQHEKKDHVHDESVGDRVSVSDRNVELARAAAKERFTIQTHPPRQGEVFSADDQERQAAVRSQDWLRSLVAARGVTSHLGLVPASIVGIEGAGGDDDARYVVAASTHDYVSRVGYSCAVEMIPVAAAFPPVPPPLAFHRIERGVVEGDYDEEHPGMLRVRYSRAVDGSTKKGSHDDGQVVSTWMRVATPHAGEGGGFIALPEIGDEVLVAHVGGRGSHPVVIGSVYSEKAGSKVFDEVSGLLQKNDGKALLTRSGNLLLLKDEASAETIELRSPDGKNVLRLTLDGGPKVVVETEGDVEITAQKNVRVKAEGNIELEAAGDVRLSARGRVDLESTGTMGLRSDQAISAEGLQKVEIKGTQFKAEGTASAEVSGATVAVKGSTMTAVQGAIVKIN